MSVCVPPPPPPPHSSFCVTAYGKVHFENTSPRRPPPSPLPLSLSHLPTLCRYLETFPTLYCDKLNTKLRGGYPALAVRHIVFFAVPSWTASLRNAAPGELTPAAFSLIVQIFAPPAEPREGKSAVTVAKSLTASLSPCCINTW